MKSNKDRQEKDVEDGNAMLTAASGENNEQRKQIQHARKSQKKGKKLPPIKEGPISQRKITSFLPGEFSNSNRIIREAEQVLDKNAQLKSRIQKQDELLLQRQREREMYQHKCDQQIRENRMYKLKSKEVIKKVLGQQALQKRELRATIDFNLGYYTDTKTYVEGDMIRKLKQKIEEKNTKVRRLELEHKKAKDPAQKDRIKFSITFMNKEIQDEEFTLCEKQKIVQAYKEKLRLSEKQKNCYYAKLNWPVIKDKKDNEVYLTLELLGKGGFGEVYKCFDLEKFEYAAIKIINMDFYPGEQHSQTILKHVQRQIDIQKTLKHPNIVEIKEVLFQKERQIIFALEYCTGPELSVYLRKHKCLEESEAKQIIKQIFCALNYLADLPKKVIHYDLKPSNIMFHDGIVKLLDFGLCKEMQKEESRIQLTSQGVGTYWYLPPETFDQGEVDISEKVDVWSAGVIFFQMLYGRRPFAAKASQQRILQLDLISKEGKSLQFPLDNPQGYKVSDKAKKFITKCLAYHPENRITAKQAYQNEYFK